MPWGFLCTGSRTWTLSTTPSWSSEAGRKKCDLPHYTPSCGRSQCIADTDFNYLMVYLENHYSLTNENRIRKALTVAAHQKQYHPIRKALHG